MGTNQLNHFDEQGNAVMVDVTDKAETERCAVARGSIYVTREIFDAIAGGTVRKGDVLGTARLADRCGNGSADRRQCGAPDDLRYV